MAVSEERFAAVATRPQRKPPPFSEHNPVANLIVASLAQSSPRHERAIRDAGAFLLEVLSANEPEGPRLTLAVAMRVLAQEESTPLEEARVHLARTVDRDLLLGIAVHGLISRSAVPGGDARPHEGRREAVLRTLYLLLRMFETQVEVDALHRHFRAG